MAKNIAITNRINAVTEKLSVVEKLLIEARETGTLSPNIWSAVDSVDIQVDGLREYARTLLKTGVAKRGIK